MPAWRRSVVRVRTLLWFTAVVYAAVVLAVTVVYPRHVPPNNTINLVPLRAIRDAFATSGDTVALRQVWGNIAMFVPFGVLLPLLWGRCRRLLPLAGAAVLASVGIELVQWLVGRGASDIDDVLLNLSGAFIGWVVLSAVAAAVERSRR